MLKQTFAQITEIKSNDYKVYLDKCCALGKVKTLFERNMFADRK